MFKSFTLAVLPFVVLAKGKNDGSSGDNAITTKLMDTDKFTLNLHHYNAESAQTNEFHGDIDLQIKSGAISNQEFGFCFKKSGEYDCMRVMTSLDPEKIADDTDPDYRSNFALKDGHFSGVPEENILDDLEASIESPEVNWKLIAAKSYKTCKEDEATTQPTDGNKIVTCEAANAHWYRNFMTLQQDVVLDIRQKPRTSYKVKGYRLKHAGADLKTPSGDYIWGEEKMIQLVTDNYQHMAEGDAPPGTIGTTADDPILTELINDDNVILTLGHYNTKGDDENIFNHSQFHGDLFLQVKAGR